MKYLSLLITGIQNELTIENKQQSFIWKSMIDTVGEFFIKLK